MNKIPKYVVIIACILVMVVLLPLGYVRYKTRYEAEQISVSTSPDGDYKLVIYSVGDPDFPFGAAHGRLVLNGKEKTVAYRSFEVANDGARFDESDLKTTWYIDRVEVVVSGSEQRDELVTMRFNGQTSSRRLTTRYRREDTDIEKDSEQDSAITEKASGDSRENAESSTDSSVDPDVNDQPENKEITVGYQAIFEKYSDATAGKFEVYYGASESSSRCILSESDNSVEYRDRLKAHIKLPHHKHSEHPTKDLYEQTSRRKLLKALRLPLKNILIVRQLKYDLIRQSEQHHPK